MNIAPHFVFFAAATRRKSQHVTRAGRINGTELHRQWRNGGRLPRIDPIHHSAGAARPIFTLPFASTTKANADGIELSETSRSVASAKSVLKCYGDQGTVLSAG